MILFIDDEKRPEWFGLPEDTVHAKTFVDAIKHIRRGFYDTVWLEYDLDDPMLKGVDVLHDAERHNVLPKKVCCISWNADGCRRIETTCNNYGIAFELHSDAHNLTIIDGQSG